MTKRRLIAPLCLISLWVIASVTRWPSPRALPTLSEFLATTVSELGSRTIWIDLGASLTRLTIGLALAIVFGASIGILLGHRREVWRAAEPTLDFLRAIPPILTFPLFLLGFGYGETARIAAVAFGTIGIVLLHVANGLQRAPQARADTIRVAGVTGFRAFLYLHIYEAVPSLVIGIRIALAAGLVIVVVTEMIVGAEHGLGARALAALLGYRADILWLVIWLSGILGSALSSAVAAVERRLIHWEA